jgi:hypothetical protein
MGILDAGIDFLKAMKYEFSEEPFIVGLRFEDYKIWMQNQRRKMNTIEMGE